MLCNSRNYYYVDVLISWLNGALYNTVIDFNIGPVPKEAFLNAIDGHKLQNTALNTIQCNAIVIWYTPKYKIQIAQ